MLNFDATQQFAAKPRTQQACRSSIWNHLHSAVNQPQRIFHSAPVISLAVEMYGTHLQSAFIAVRRQYKLDDKNLIQFSMKSGSCRFLSDPIEPRFMSWNQNWLTNAILVENLGTSSPSNGFVDTCGGQDKSGDAPKSNVCLSLDIYVMFQAVKTFPHVYLTRQETQNWLHSFSFQFVWTTANYFSPKQIQKNKQNVCVEVPHWAVIPSPECISLLSKNTIKKRIRQVLIAAFAETIHKKKYYFYVNSSQNIFGFECYLTIKIDILPISSRKVDTLWSWFEILLEGLYPSFFLSLFDPTHPPVTLKRVPSHPHGERSRMSIRVRVQVRFKDGILQGGQVIVPQMQMLQIREMRETSWWYFRKVIAAQWKDFQWT